MRPFADIQHMAIVGPGIPPPDPNNGGCFRLRGLNIIAAWAAGWDHVSVSRRDRCPTWDEMEMVKRAFFRDDETAMQLHVPPSDHVNIHPYCLHMWRPHFLPIPTPPRMFV